MSNAGPTLSRHKLKCCETGEVIRRLVTALMKMLDEDCLIYLALSSLAGPGLH